MKISVIEPGKHNIRIRIPSALVLNRFSACIAAKAAQKSGASLTFEQVYAFITAVKDYKRSHADWKFVEVQSADGEYIEIVI